jgi:hypothetical protein
MNLIGDPNSHIEVACSSPELQDSVSLSGRVFAASAVTVVS